MYFEASQPSVRLSERDGRDHEAKAAEIVIEICDGVDTHKASGGSKAISKMSRRRIKICAGISSGARFL